MFALLESALNFATKLTQHYPPHLKHIATLPWKLKIQIFGRYSADMEENVNQLHFVPSNFVIHPQILIFSVFNIASFSPY